MTTDVMVLMIGACGLVGVMLIIIGIFLVLKRLKGDAKTQYEVFDFSDSGRMTVLTGFPVTYWLDDVQKVVFSISSRGINCHGRFQIIKRDGRKSRTYIYDASAYTKKLSFSHRSLADIQKSTEYLMQQVRAEGIFCEFEGKHMRGKL